MKTAIAFAIAIAIIGCATPKQLNQQVHETRVDTLYLSNVKYDSIYVYQERFQDRSHDTLYIRNKSIEYNYKFLRETILKVQHDSILYEVVRIETKEITRPLTIFDRLCRICFYFLAGALFVILVKFVFNLKSKIRL